MTYILMLIVAWLLAGFGVAWFIARASDCAGCGMLTPADLAGGRHRDDSGPARCVACIERRSVGRTEERVRRHVVSLPEKRIVQ